MVLIPHNNELFERPSWLGARKANGEQTALVKCPNGHISSLSGHTIAGDGTVKPSVVCPHEGCTWHVHIKLKDWHE